MSRGMNYQGISVICQGDTTTTGGRVLEGVQGNRYTCDGIPVALKGHKVSCPACGKIGVIAEGEANLSFYGVPTALDGHLVACGCPVGSHRLVASSQPLSVAPSISPSSMLMNNGQVAEPAQYAQSVKKQAAEPEQHAQAAKKERQKREITLTIGVFFDGTGNNADNTAASLDACSGEHFGMNNADAQSAYFQCVQLKSGHSGFAAGSHLGYYTNVHWLNTLYSTNLPVDSEQGQNAIYIEGIGTESGEGDSAYGMGTGRGNSGVVSKTDKAVRALVAAIKDYLTNPSGTDIDIVRELQFDIFGFSRGAAAARHFANLLFCWDSVIDKRVYETRLTLPDAVLEKMRNPSVYKDYQGNIGYYDNIQIGLAPGGKVAVWLRGIGSQPNYRVTPSVLKTVSGDKLELCKGITKSDFSYGYDKDIIEFIKGKAYPYGNW